MQELLGTIRSNSKVNVPLSGHKGFSVNGVHCRGALNALGASFYNANFRSFKVGRRGAGGSSLSLGEAFHRHVFHAYMCGSIICACKPGKKTKCTCKKKLCLCKEKFGKATRRTRANSISITHMLDEFKNFLKDNNLKVFDCEVVVGFPNMRIATAIDVLCVDSLKNPTELCVLELKTGYLFDRLTPRTIGTSKMMQGEAGSKIPNSVHNHHQLQLWFGAEALTNIYAKNVSRSYVVYLNPGRKYAAYKQESWWSTPSLRVDLLSQLNTSLRRTYVQKVISRAPKRKRKKATTTA